MTDHETFLRHRRTLMNLSLDDDGLINVTAPVGFLVDTGCATYELSAPLLLSTPLYGLSEPPRMHSLRCGACDEEPRRYMGEEVEVERPGGVEPMLAPPEQMTPSSSSTVTRCGGST